MNPERLAELRRKFAGDTEPPKPRQFDEEKFRECEDLATQYLRPYLEQINTEVLGGRGVFTTTRHTFASIYNAGWELTWDRNGSAGRRLALGVSDGMFHQIYTIAGNGAPTIFASLHESSGVMNADWQNKVSEQLFKYLEQHPDWLIYGQ